MRLLVDLRSHLSTPPAPQIVQVQRVPVEGSQGATVVNGQFIVPLPPNVDFPVDLTSYLLDGSGEIDGGDVVSKGYAHLLAAYPQFGNIYFNPLLTADHVGELVVDRSVSFRDDTLSPPVEFYPRFQTGRESGGADAGCMPTHTALMPANTAVTPTRPGLIITDEIDIGPYTLDCDNNEVGADHFLVYWRIYTFDVSHDVAADWGALAGSNTPALRSILETDQEPTDLKVYLSTDNGANWSNVGLMEPIAFCGKSKKIRLAFRNNGTSKIHLATYALLF